MTFSLRTFLVLAFIAGILVLLGVSQYGILDPPSQIRSIIRKLESTPEPLGYEQFLETLNLPEGSLSPPMGSGYIASYHWDLEGYQLAAQFDNRTDGHLLSAVIHSFNGTNQSKVVWQWAERVTVPSD